MGLVPHARPRQRVEAASARDRCSAPSPGAAGSVPSGSPGSRARRQYEGQRRVSRFEPAPVALDRERKAIRPTAKASAVFRPHAHHLYRRGR